MFPFPFLLVLGHLWSLSYFFNHKDNSLRDQNVGLHSHLYKIVVLGPHPSTFLVSWALGSKPPLQLAPFVGRVTLNPCLQFGVIEEWQI